MSSLKSLHGGSVYSHHYCIHAAYCDYIGSSSPYSRVGFRVTLQPTLSNCAIRGGSWLSPAWRCRSAYRYWRRFNDRRDNQGFRACLVP